MYAINVISIPLKEANERFAGLLDLTPPNAIPPEGRIAACEILLPSPYSFDTEPIPTLLTWFPGWNRADVMKLLSHEIDGTDVVTQDCSYAETCILFGPKQGGLYIAMEFHDFFNIGPKRNTIRILAVGDDFVVDARHVFTGDEDQAYFWRRLPYSMNTGPNFKQHLYFTPEEILANKDKEPCFKPPGPMLTFLLDSSRHDLIRLPRLTCPPPAVPV